MTDRPSKHRQEWFGSFELDLETGATTYSEGVRRILGAPADLALTSAFVLARVHPEDRALIERCLTHSREAREATRFEVRVRRFDEAERVVRGRADVVLSPAGEAMRVAGTLHDVTDDAETRSAN